MVRLGLDIVQGIRRCVGFKLGKNERDGFLTNLCLSERKLSRYTRQRGNSSKSCWALSISLEQNEKIFDICWFLRRLGSLQVR